MLSLNNKTIWTAGNVLTLVGVYLLLYVGGLYADERYNLWAADGGSDIPLQDTVPAPTAQSIAPTVTAVAVAAGPTSTAVPATAAALLVPGSDDLDRHTRPHIELNSPADSLQLSSSVPEVGGTWGDNAITRVVIPIIKVDRKVQQVGWHLEQQNGTQVAIWDVAKYAVGHNQGTANPGQAGNIVLTGHSGGSAYPFNDLYWVPSGSKVILWENDKQFSYTVTERLIVDEIGPNVTDAQRRANAQLIEETPREQITMVTCWPLTGPQKFNQRVIVHAMPDHVASAPARQGAVSAH